MRKVIANEWMSLDGVIQSAGSDDDTTGGFKHGGWHLPYFDEIAQRWVVEGYQSAGGFLFGRRTYELLAGYWPNASEEEQAIARPLNELPKYVATRTLSDPLEWDNAHVLQGDVVEAVRALKEEDGGDLHLVGSSRLTQTMVERGLVDVFRLMIDPLLLGGGKRFLPDDGAMTRLRLLDSQVTSTGAILATYEPAEARPQSAHVALPASREARRSTVSRQPSAAIDHQPGTPSSGMLSGSSTWTVSSVRPSRGLSVTVTSGLTSSRSGSSCGQPSVAPQANTSLSSGTISRYTPPVT
jgi:dihydrofolate reductase